MNRYAKSFSITLFFYGFLLASIFFSTKLFHDRIILKQNIIKIATVTIPKPVIEQPKVVPPPPKPIEKKPEPKIEKIEKRLPPKKIEPIVKEESIPEAPPPPKPIENVEKNEVKKLPDAALITLKEQFFSELKKKIDSNKYYPKAARRRGMEGSVEVRFMITPEGKLDKLQILSGEKIFFESAKSAIAKSFPQKIPEALRSEMGEVTLALEYKLI